MCMFICALVNLLAASASWMKESNKDFFFWCHLPNIELGLKVCSDSNVNESLNNSLHVTRMLPVVINWSFRTHGGGKSYRTTSQR